MGFLLKGTNRFFQNVGTGFRRFGHQVSKGLRTAGEFVAKKALPVIEKVAKGVATGLTYAAPAIGVLAPELAPLAMGAKALASTIGNAASTGRKVIRSVNEVASGIQSGNAQRIIGGVQSGASAMKISVPRVPDAIAAMRRLR
jgi:hypothetical protein